MRYFYITYEERAATAADAAWIFKSRIHQLLRSQQTILLFPILRDGPRPKNFVYNYCLEQNPMDLRLRDSDESPLVEGGGFYVNTCHRLTSPEFPGIDSLLIVHPPNGSPPILLIFSIAHNAKVHDVSEEGFRRINNLGLSPDTRMYYVVVTPECIEPEIRIPEGYFMKGREKAPGKVFNYPIPMNVLLPES